MCATLEGARSRKSWSMVSQAPDRLSAALADRHTIERELGRGGMATVYLAEEGNESRAEARPSAPFRAGLPHEGGASSMSRVLACECRAESR